MKKISGLTMMLFIVVLLLSGCSPSEDKQAKEILADYFLQREAKLYIDDYQKTGVVETKSIENKELIIVNDGDTKNKLYLFEPTTEKKTNPVFLVDVAKKEVFQKILTTKQAGVPVYVKVSPLLTEDLVDTAFAKIETETTTDLKEEVTKQLETAKTELYDTASSSGTTSSSGTSDQSGSSQSGSGTNSGSGASSGSGTTTDPGSGGTTDPGTTDPGSSDNEMPAATLEFYKSLSPGMKIALVKLDTDKPENYKVTYAGETLTYKADFGAYVGDVPQTAAENLEPVTTKR